jgi:hypothetical protein
MPLQSCVAPRGAAAGAGLVETVCAQQSVAPVNASVANASLGAQCFMMFSADGDVVAAFSPATVDPVIGEMMIRRKTDSDTAPACDASSSVAGCGSCRNMGSPPATAPAVA